ncbi:synaptogenesis protein syg-2-like isoform X2 [Eriocheir sinensis]|uniref:synaptogenesis protein syg-2-like isoform X2 n=1 Tax=Eriocheir sinensis TaxID=95602 RepID=UPI0021C65224|nr:synaptogenesis protein syg-2-like isoform X2 [Eriocheir sinensis]
MFCSHNIVDFTEDVVEEVQAVYGEAARLPCNMTVNSGDTVYLVLWFKEELATPIYSYDVRELLRGQPKHWWDADLLGSRAFFNAGSSPHLLLQGLTSADAGLYKCRVDFQREPTRNTRINLTVVVPPRKLVLVEDNGAEVRSFVGPINEGDDLHLSCVAHGGRPAPSVVWLMDNKVIDDVVESREGELTRNDLALRGVTRAMLRTQLTCQAANNQVSQPLSHTATLDMNLRPLDVTIHHIREPLSAGRAYEVLCSSRGSRPPAVLTWWWGSARVPAADDTTSHGGNVSSSMVRLTPNASDDGRLLSCRAENRNLPTAVIEDTWKLSVYYTPTSEAVLGASLNPQNIREGDDVYFECHVRANPRAYKVVWKHNGVEVRQERANGILLTNRSLVVQEVTRTHAGRYTCQASNVEGDSTSPPVILAVQYAPLCRPGQVSVYGVSKLEDAHVTCQVDAVPQVTRFYWTFNNTVESLEVPQERFTVGLGGRSVVIFTPTSDLEYGTLLCAAENMVGRQKDPCVFHIIPATKPEAPTNCSLYNVSSSSLTVSCSPGFDGGLNQTFAMEVYGTNPHSLKANITSNIPRFVVTGLDNESEFQLIVYAGNSKGRSSITRLVAITQKLPVKQLETRLSNSGNDAAGVTQDTPSDAFKPLLGIFGGVGLIAVLLVVIAVIVIKVQCSAEARRRRAQGEGSDGEDKRQRQVKSKKQLSQDFERHQLTVRSSRSEDEIPKDAGAGPVNTGERYADYRPVHLHQHHDDQSPDVVACSGDFDDVNVSIRPGGAMTLMAEHLPASQHLQRPVPCHHPPSTLVQHTHQRQKQHQSPSPSPHNQQQQQQHHQQQQQSPLLLQHTKDPIHYSLATPGIGSHEFHHPHPHRQPHLAPARMCDNVDMDVHFSEAVVDSGTPPAPAPADDLPVPLMFVGDGQGKHAGASGVACLARIPEDPESPSSRRESAV